MPRNFIKKHLPDTDELRKHSAMQALGGGVLRPQLWHLNRRSVSGAVAVGLFLGWMPVPMQMVLAALAAMVLHVNLPISVLLVWISNPFTLPALVYAAYQTGALLLSLQPGSLTFEPTFSWVLQLLNMLAAAVAWLPDTGDYFGACGVCTYAPAVAVNAVAQMEGTSAAQAFTHGKGLTAQAARRALIRALSL